MGKSSTTCQCNEIENSSEKHQVNQSNMNKNEDVHVSMAIVVRIFNAEFEIGHVGVPCPILTSNEPGKKKKIQDSIGKDRAI
jgi:hypothetical protein